MLRDTLKAALKAAMIEKNSLKTTTIRMVMAAIKDKDIAARMKDNPDGITNDAILSLLQSLIKQRNDSIKMYEDANRPELAAKEQDEIDLITAFLPAQLSVEEVTQIIKDVIAETGATSMKDMGKIMAILKEKYAGKMDFSKTSQLIKAAF